GHGLAFCELYLVVSRRLGYHDWRARSTVDWLCLHCFRSTAAAGRRQRRRCVRTRRRIVRRISSLMASNGMKIAIVGGGLAGLAAAMKIAEAGHAVDLFSVVPVK